MEYQSTLLFFSIVGILCILAGILVLIFTKKLAYATRNVWKLRNYSETEGESYQTTRFITLGIGLIVLGLGIFYLVLRYSV